MPQVEMSGFKPMIFKSYNATYSCREGFRKCQSRNALIHLVPLTTVQLLILHDAEHTMTLAPVAITLVKEICTGALHLFPVISIFLPMPAQLGSQH